MVRTESTVRYLNLAGSIAEAENTLGNNIAKVIGTENASSCVSLRTSRNVNSGGNIRLTGASNRLELSEEFIKHMTKVPRYL
jgi:hypothetical protein